MKAIGALRTVSFAHPQGCCGYLVADAASREALAVDPHLDFVHDMAERVAAEGWTLRTVVDTHTHADHPSGAGALAARTGAVRMAHEKAGHAGVGVALKDGDRIRLGGQELVARHAPGHTPDHLVLVADGALFAGDTLFIGGVARTDFLGGDAGQLFDTLRALLAELPGGTVLFPGHDYHGQTESTLDQERRTNPWLQIADRGEFVRLLTANPPPRPANMDDLLRLNREGVNIPDTVSAAEAVRLVAAGGAPSVIDVRTGAEYAAEHIPGAHLIPLDQLEARLNEVRAVPAPRLVLCRSGGRAAMAKKTLEQHHVAGLRVVEGGLGAYVAAGGKTVKGKSVLSLERQVRIAAGALVLLGVLLGSFVHAGFLALAGFVGAGLVFAGVTDWCGMGLLLAKMPWNQVKAGEGEPASHGGTCAASLPGGCAAGAPGAGSCAVRPSDKK